MKRFPFLLILGAILLSACTSSQARSSDSSEAIVITDALGRQVSLPAPPQRIAITGQDNDLGSKKICPARLIQSLTQPE